MRTNNTFPGVRAVHHGGVLKLLDAVELPEGAHVRLSIESVVLEAPETLSEVDLMFPTRLVPAERLDALTALVEVGGDALSDSEALYDPDWD
jgi:predicted DNA-binding antitoxin AbrB/MazE fold protein